MVSQHRKSVLLKRSLVFGQRKGFSLYLSDVLPLKRSLIPSAWTRARDAFNGKLAVMLGGRISGVRFGMSGCNFCRFAWREAVFGLGNNRRRCFGENRSWFCSFSRFLPLLSFTPTGLEASLILEVSFSKNRGNWREIFYEILSNWSKFPGLFSWQFNWCFFFLFFFGTELNWCCGI